MWATHGLAVALALSVLPGGRALRPGDCEGTAGRGGLDSTQRVRDRNGRRRPVPRDLPEEGPGPGAENITWGEKKLGPGGTEDGLTGSPRRFHPSPPLGSGSRAGVGIGSIWLACPFVRSR